MSPVSDSKTGSDVGVFEGTDVGSEVGNSVGGSPSVPETSVTLSIAHIPMSCSEETFADIFEAIDSFVYFENRRK